MVWSVGYRGRRGAPLPATRTSARIEPDGCAEPHENRTQVFSPTLANKDEAAASETRDWQQVRVQKPTGSKRMPQRRLRFDRLGCRGAAKPRRGGIMTRCLILFLRVGPR